jgi:outer membrane biosynthesis protein TonB
MSVKCRENKHPKPFSRLATVRQLAISTVALALGAAAALGLVSCGGGEDAKLLPGNTAAEITENLDRVKQYAEEGECVGAEDAVSEVNAQVEGLSGVDPKLVEALQRGATRLSEVVASCDGEEEDTEAVAPESEATTTEETEKVPPGQEKKAEKEREKEEKELEKEAEKAEKEEPPATETTPEEKPAPPTTPAPEGGGTGASGGVSPGAPAAPGGE